jgi:hypothetical protein
MIKIYFCRYTLVLRSPVIKEAFSGTVKGTISKGDFHISPDGKVTVDLQISKYSPGIAIILILLSGYN